MCQGNGIVAPVMVTQRHSTLQATQSSMDTFQQASHICAKLKTNTFHCSFSNTEVGTGSRRLLCYHQLVVLEHPS